ncbi:hypothetical protein D3C87_1972790 [compost metagenome]
MIRLRSTTTSLSTKLPPADLISAAMPGYPVKVRPFSNPAWARSWGPWQIAAMVIPALSASWTNRIICGSFSKAAGDLPPGIITAS